MSRFNEILKDVDGKIKHLPLLHSCDGYGFRSILESERLEPAMCKIFKEKYLYAYYGIPSYRKSLEEASKNMAFFPICFILNHRNIPDLDRLHPFDTGAFFKIPEIKNEYFHPKMELADFELDPSIRNAVRVVEKFYSTNKKYIENNPSVSTSEFGETEFEARSYSSLISNEANTRYDNRVSTIEMIYKQFIPLNKDSLLQVIIPNSFLDDSFVRDKLIRAFDIDEPLTYYTLKGNPVENFGSIYNEYRKFAESKSLI